MKPLTASSVSMRMFMLSRKLVTGLGAVVLAAALPVWAEPSTPSTAAAPVYNPSAEVRFSAVITGVRQVTEGPLTGTHVTAQSKAGVADVYLGPSDFLKIFKTNFPVGAGIQVIGARATVGDGQTIMAREVTEGDTTLTLRDFGGAPVWEHWGAAVDPSAAVGD